LVEGEISTVSGAEGGPLTCGALAWGGVMRGQHSKMARMRIRVGGGAVVRDTQQLFVDECASELCG
jgi:hypothetical protein